MSKLSSTYWDDRYRENDFPWDLGEPSLPLLQFCQTKLPKDAKILIAGAGLGHDQNWLIQNGWVNTYSLDWSSTVKDKILNTYPLVPEKNIFVEDFFQHSGNYDTILEQTFFCAIDPEDRMRYAAKVGELLNPGGVLAGVLFNFPLIEDGPPFGGSATEYHDILARYLTVLRIDQCENSMPSRVERELFFEARKPGPPGASPVQRVSRINTTV